MRRSRIFFFAALILLTSLIPVCAAFSRGEQAGPTPRPPGEPGGMFLPLVWQKFFFPVTDTPTPTSTTTARPPLRSSTPTATSNSPAPTATATQTSAGPTSTKTPTATPTKTAKAVLSPTPTGTATQTQAAGPGIIANHLVVSQFENIPDSALPAASAKRVLFVHASVGAQITAVGLEWLQGTAGGSPYPPYKYDRRNWNWPAFSGGASIFQDKINEFRQTWVPNYQANNDMLGMKVCYIDWWGSDWTIYRDMMLQLESTYPGKTFLWTTQPVMKDWEPIPAEEGDHCTLVKNFNDGVRSYALNNNKPLYDIADIESHDANGNACYTGCETMCSQYAQDVGHPNQEGAVRLAKAFWWYMARLTGWNGQ